MDEKDKKKQQQTVQQPADAQEGQQPKSTTQAQGTAPAPITQQDLAPQAAIKTPAVPELNPRMKNEVGMLGTTPESYAGGIFQLTNPYKLPSREEIERENKRRKANKIIAAVSDGISSIANMVGANRGAAPFYDPSTGLSARQKAMYDKIDAERQANRDKWIAAQNNINNINYERTMAALKAKRQRQRDEAADKLAWAKEERDRQLFDLNVQLQGHKITAAEAEEKIKQIEAKYADQLQQAKVDTEQKKGSSYAASAGASKARADYYNRQGSDNSGGYPWYDADGNLHYAKTYDEMRANALNAGTWKEVQEKTVKSELIDGDILGTVETYKPGRGYSVKPQTSTSDNTPPSRRNNNDNTPPSRR